MDQQRALEICFQYRPYEMVYGYVRQVLLR